MPRQQVHWNKLVILYILQSFSSVQNYPSLQKFPSPSSCPQPPPLFEKELASRQPFPPQRPSTSQINAAFGMQVHLVAPRYVIYGNTAVLYCEHDVPTNLLRKVEFMKGEKKIFQYITERKPPFVEWPVDGANMEYSENGTTIELKDVRYEASGSYSCEVSMTTPIYTEPSESIPLKVIVPQTENPKITFKKSVYVVGENLEANCSSSAAHPVPHLTWYINDKEVDITLVTHFPHTQHKDRLMSATAKLTIEVSSLHAGENGYLEISCHSTIPDYPLYRDIYADIRKKTVSVQIIPAPVAIAGASKAMQIPLLLFIILCSFSVVCSSIP